MKPVYLLLIFLFITLVNGHDDDKFYYSTTYRDDALSIREMPIISSDFSAVTSIRMMIFPIGYKHPGDNRLFIKLDTDEKRIWMSDYDNWEHHHEVIKCDGTYPTYRCEGWSNVMLQIYNPGLWMERHELICKEHRFDSCHLKMHIGLTPLGKFIWILVAVLAIPGIPAIVFAILWILLKSINGVLNLFHLFFIGLSDRVCPDSDEKGYDSHIDESSADL